MSEINTATGEKSAALDNLESLVSVHPDLRSFLAADPDLKALRDIYEFRVLTGLQQPIEVDDLKLPEELQHVLHLMEQRVRIESGAVTDSSRR